MFDFLPSWLLVIPILAFLIFVHELGHFFTAKWFGIGVVEFGFGFPPRLIGVRPVGNGRFRLVIPPFLQGPTRRLARDDGRPRPESYDAEDGRATIYSINVIPLGGFVRMVGEEDPDAPNSFARQHPLKRIVVLCAGSFMNLAVCVVILTALLTIGRDTVVGQVSILGVAPNSPAAEAGLRAGDAIVAIDGHSIDNHGDLIIKTMARLGAPTEFSVRRGSIVSGLGASPEYAAVEAVTVTPRIAPPELLVVDVVSDPEREVTLTQARRYDASLGVGDTLRQGSIGVMIGTANARVVKKSYPVWQAVPMSLGGMWELLAVTKNGIHRWIAGGDDPGLAGPVGIAQVTGQAASAGGLLPVLELTAFISLSLAIVNILPIPALDGGRLMFVLIEWARGGKRISPQREGLIHLAGFAALIGLIIVITYFDVSRILNGEGF